MLSRWCSTQTFFRFSPRSLGKMIQFHLRIFFRWVGSTTNRPDVIGSGFGTSIPQALQSPGLWLLWRVWSRGGWGFKSGKSWRLTTTTQGLMERDGAIILQTNESTTRKWQCVENEPGSQLHWWILLDVGRCILAMLEGRTCEVSCSHDSQSCHGRRPSSRFIESVEHHNLLIAKRCYCWKHILPNHLGK